MEQKIELFYSIQQQDFSCGGNYKTGDFTALTRAVRLKVLYELKCCTKFHAIEIS